MIRDIFINVFTKKNLKNCCSHLWYFFKRIYVTFFLFALGGGIPFVIAAAILLVLSLVGVPGYICLIVIKILFTVAAVISFLIMSIIKEEDNHDEISMEICIMALIMIVVLVWKRF